MYPRLFCQQDNTDREAFWGNMKETIYEYEKSPWWKEYTSRLLSPPDTVCEICGKPHWHVNTRNGSKHQAGQKYSLRRFNVHHKHYRHPYREERNDIMVLCNTHHELGHALADLAWSDPNRFGPLYDLWKEITGWESEYNDRKRSK